MSDTLGVGIIGVNATRSERSAEEAATAFGIDRSYGDPLELIGDRQVDIVGIAASVPAHRELILAAIAGGKHVLTEWPVGLDSEQNSEIVAAAANAGDVHVAVGLQARLNLATVAVTRPRPALPDSHWPAHGRFRQEASTGRFR